MTLTNKPFADSCSFPRTNCVIDYSLAFRREMQKSYPESVVGTQQQRPTTIATKRSSSSPQPESSQPASASTYNRNSYLDTSGQTSRKRKRNDSSSNSGRSSSSGNLFHGDTSNGGGSDEADDEFEEQDDYKQFHNSMSSYTAVQSSPRSKIKTFAMRKTNSTGGARLIQSRHNHSSTLQETHNKTAPNEDRKRRSGSQPRKRKIVSQSRMNTLEDILVPSPDKANERSKTSNGGDDQHNVFDFLDHGKQKSNRPSMPSREKSTAASDTSEHPRRYIVDRLGRTRTASSKLAQMFADESSLLSISEHSVPYSSTPKIKSNHNKSSQPVVIDLDLSQQSSQSHSFEDDSAQTHAANRETKTLQLATKVKNKKWVIFFGGPRDYSVVEEKRGISLTKNGIMIHSKGVPSTDVVVPLNISTKDVEVCWECKDLKLFGWKMKGPIHSVPPEIFDPTAHGEKTPAEQYLFVFYCEDSEYLDVVKEFIGSLPTSANEHMRSSMSTDTIKECYISSDELNAFIYRVNAIRGADVRPSADDTFASYDSIYRPVTRRTTRSQTLQARARHEDDTTVVLSYQGIQITAGDLTRLEPGEFLNDNLIDFYLIHLQEQHENAHRFHLFNTHFWPLLNRDIDRCAQRIPSPHVKLFKKEYIVVPINEGVHWTVCVVFRPDMEGEDITTDVGYRRGLMYMDSLGSSTGVQTKVNKRLRHFLTKRHLVENPDSTTSKKIDTHTFPGKLARTPGQDNHCDCGVFALHYIELLMINPPDEFPSVDTKWFDTEEIALKRLRIKKLIELYQDKEKNNDAIKQELLNVKIRQEEFERKRAREEEEKEEEERRKRELKEEERKLESNDIIDDESWIYSSDPRPVHGAEIIPCNGFRPSPLLDVSGFSAESSDDDDTEQHNVLEERTDSRSESDDNEISPPPPLSDDEEQKTTSSSDAIYTHHSAQKIANAFSEDIPSGDEGDMEFM